MVLAMEKGFTSGRYQDGWQGQWPLSLGKPEVLGAVKYTKKGLAKNKLTP